MKKGTKIAIVGLGAAAIGTAIYLYMKSRAAAPAASLPGSAAPAALPQGTNPANVLETASSVYSTVSSVLKPQAMTLAQLRAKTWVNNAGSTIPQGYIEAYDPLTGTVIHGADKRWVGKLVDANTINWTYILGGQSDTWKAGVAVSGLGSVRRTAYSGLLR